MYKKIRGRKKTLRNVVSLIVTGDDLLSQAVSSQVPSALKGLTSVFGMRTGGSPSPLSPEWLNVFAHSQLHSIFQYDSIFNSLLDYEQAFDLLVSVSSTHYYAYTPDLSPCSLQGVLLP